MESQIHGILKLDLRNNLAELLFFFTAEEMQAGGGGKWLAQTHRGEALQTPPGSYRDSNGTVRKS